MENLNIGIIGTGYLGKLHSKLLVDAERADFIGVYDSDEVEAQKVADSFGVNRFENSEKLFDFVDAVIIVTPTPTHYQIAKEALLKGKHVFIEKPITVEVSEAEELVEIAKEKNLKIQVGHIERFNPALLSLEKYNLEPMFMQTDRLAQFNPRGSDVAVVLDLMIHDIDIILSLIKSKVKRINASGVAVVSDNIDIANARIEFENGAVANVTASRISQKKMRKMRMFQRDAYLSLDFTSGTAEVYRLLKPMEDKPQKFFPLGEMGIGEKKRLVVFEQPEIMKVNAMKYEQQLFIDSILDDKRPVVNGEDGLRALKIAGMIIEKINDNKLLKTLSV
jgi:predicted dehydrogenase